MIVKQVIGVDCATQPVKVGLARAVKEVSGWVLADLCPGTKGLSPAHIVASWILGKEGPTLLALDAPLGWPKGLGAALALHRAGAVFVNRADLLFRRETDRFVRRVTGKQPLDVGAGRIARTAHWSLGFLEKIRKLTGKAVPLAWQKELKSPVEALEVYPAATLLGHLVQIAGYKNPENVERREAVVNKLQEYLEVSEFRKALLAGEHLLDAAVCVWAGLDFLAGEALPPSEEEISRQEGWIWFRAPKLPEGPKKGGV